MGREGHGQDARGTDIARGRPPRNGGVGGTISDCRLGPSTRLRLAQDDAGRQFQIAD